MEVMEIINEIFNNATVMELSDTVTNIFLPLIMVGIGAGVLALLFFVSGNISKYRRAKKIFKFLYTCFSYCAYGMLTVAVVGIPCFVGWNLIQYAGNNPEGSVEFLKWSGIAIGAFIGFTLLGYATKNRIWKRIWKFHKLEKENKEYKKNMDELPKTIQS